MDQCESKGKLQGYKKSITLFVYWWSVNLILNYFTDNLYEFELGFDWVCVNVAIELCKGPIKGMEIEYVDISPLPMLNTDLEVNGTYPPAVEAFRQKILKADSILFASPEYNYSVSGTLTSPLLYPFIKFFCQTNN